MEVEIRMQMTFS